MHNQENLRALRSIITESLRVQKDTQGIDYVQIGSTLDDAASRQNHVIFARRGCGKTLLLHKSAEKIPLDRKIIYLNCEDFKKHSFPNVLIEILIAIFKELDRNIVAWFGKKKKIKIALQETQRLLSSLQPTPDEREEEVKSEVERRKEQKAETSIALPSQSATLSSLFGILKIDGNKFHRSYIERTKKIEKLDLVLPRLKEQLREFFNSSKNVTSIIIQVDDLYHLRRLDQAFVADYIHRLCKDLPIYFKFATLRHVSTLYVEVSGQPIGAQERHDYQPINIDFNFSNFSNTRSQNWKILCEFAKQCGVNEEEVQKLFKGDGFTRLVMAGGGVPRDVLSLFLEALSRALSQDDPRIGKDNVRELSKEVFERRIEELKQDSKEEEQDTLLRGIYVIRKFCMDKKNNIFCVREKDIQQQDELRELLYRLLDYRIIHLCADALTHKSQEGSYKAFAVDIGSYAFLRKYQGKMTEIDVSDSGAKEKMRSAPILSIADFPAYASKIPDKIETVLLEEDES